ncbi:hypothetical protein CY35_08G112500 [Sphagnum magellanicum]|nr:hypothetical protein CY35_08G112500 [Sphagnum magellanicum]KAH9555400.1 hypothetical protein CY35_08G112500 [Sphagnum magellanicum]KAH9555401.1 hypothetical protein CY35_08G112500 [Sphagnum magellanicum]KAH9555403.1 hypothetical protein CY35_08G112500 [Sphagnum magellanicum]
MEQQIRDRMKEVEIVVAAVLAGSRASMINVNQCRSLANVFAGIETYLKGCPADSLFYTDALFFMDEIIRILEKGKVLVLQYGSAQWFELAVTRGDNWEAFEEIHLLLKTYIKKLHYRAFSGLPDMWKFDLLKDGLWKVISIAENSMRANAKDDHDKILETLQMFHENLPTAIAKLKGTPDMYNLPINMQIDSRQVKCGKTIGKGAYGLVRTAYWLGCNFAAKIIRTRDMDALRKEVGILSKLRHPHIVQLVGFSTDCSTSMILMELMDGDLRHLIKDRVESSPQAPPFPEGVAIDIISQIAAGMAYLHEQGVFHGDLKASNVLVNQRAAHIEVKIADFGVSQAVQLKKRFDTSKRGDGDITSSSSIYSNSSFSGIVGTTGWRAPEVSHIQPKEGETSSVIPKYTAKADIFSFAMTCYEVVSGQLPYSSDLPRQEVNKLVREGGRPELLEHINRKLSSLIQKCWQTEAAKRPTFEQICLDLQKITKSYDKYRPAPLSNSKDQISDRLPLTAQGRENSWCTIS